MAKRKTAKKAATSAESETADGFESSINTSVRFGWTNAEEMEHIDIDERHAKIELFVRPFPPENYKATDVVVHLDLSAVPESVVVFTPDHPDPITEDTYPVKLKGEFRYGAITRETPLEHLPKIALFLATGAFAECKKRTWVDRPDIYTLSAAKGDETFQIRVSQVVCRTVPIINFPKPAIIEGDPIEIKVRD